MYNHTNGAHPTAYALTTTATLGTTTRTPVVPQEVVMEIVMAQTEATNGETVLASSH